MNPAAHSMDSLPRYVVFGEALTDFILQDDGSWLALAGGSCWNVARVGARLGVATAFAGAISQDLFGEQLASESAAAGLDRRFLQRVDAPPFLAMVGSRNPPTYFFIGENSADLRFDPQALPAGWRSAAEVVHVGGLGLAREPLATRLVDEARAAHAAGLKVAFDPNFRDPMRAPAYREVFAAVARLARYIKVSEEDLEGLYPGMSANEALANLRLFAPQADVLYSRGAQGMTLFTGATQCEEAAFAVDVVDTVGCGDAAMGAWMASLLLHPGFAPADHLRFAIATASCVATRAGPYAPTASEVEHMLGAHAQDAEPS